MQGWCHKSQGFLCGVEFCNPFIRIELGVTQVIPCFVQLSAIAVASEQQLLRRPYDRLDRGSSKAKKNQHFALGLTCFARYTSCAQDRPFGRLHSCPTAMSRASIFGRTLILLLLSTQLVSAQSLTAGRVEGVLRDAARRPVFDALVSLVERTSGARFEATTDRDGSFSIATLPVGRYAFTAEALGYVPLRVLEVAVTAGPVTRLDFTLRTATPPVNAVDTLPGGSGRVQTGGWLLERGYADLVGERRLGSDLSAFSTNADALSIEGLPWRYAAPMLDGALGVSRASPPGNGAEAAGAQLPLRFIAEAEIGGLGSDVEVGGSGVGIRASSMLGGRVPASRLIAEGGSNSYGAGFSVSGPLQGDTARAVFGADYQRLERGFAEDEALDPRIEERASVNGRFDWQANDRLAITARGSATHTTAAGIALREGPMVGAGRSYELTAAQFLLNARGRITQRLSHEWRLSADVGASEGENRNSIRSDIASMPSRLGRAADGRFDQDWLTPRLSGMLHFEWGAHRFKLGFSQAVHRMGSDYLRDGDGVYALGDSLAIANGAWRRVVGTGLNTDLRVRESAYFLQDAWQVAPGLSLTLGARISGVRLPTGSIEGNGNWLAASGLDNRIVDGTSSSLSPRVGVRWELGRNAAWVIEGDLGTYNDIPDLRDLAEALTLDRGQDVRYGVGTFDLTAAPTLADAPVVGRTLTMLAPQFAGPRTQRASLGLAHRRGEWRASLSGSFRHTDFLARRRDLNLPSALGSDQFGRPLYGTLSQQDAALVVEPGTNRRFAGFDAVHVLEPTGYSTYWGVTLGLDRSVANGLSTLFQYTFSNTVDNVLGFGSTQISPFPDGLVGEDWAEGRSDFDVPHRLLFAAEWRQGERMAIGGVYRLRSGLPYTPGVRGGVDANGDGDWTNDPAFIDAALLPAGVDACVRRSIGSFAERNACRDEMAHGFDLRATFRLARTSIGGVDVVIDAVDVLASKVGPLDRALLRVDPTGSVTTDPLTGVTTVPYIVNPDFGTRLNAKAPGIFWRIGMRIVP